MTARADDPWERRGLFRRATVWLAFLAPFFFVTYGLANWLAAQRAEVPSVVFDWERHIPFLAWTIVPYWSIDLFYGLSLFLCRTRSELDVHSRRLLVAQVVAVGFFLAFPLRLSVIKPPTDGFAGLLFDRLADFDQPFNQAPSLHIALLVILWAFYARVLPKPVRPILHLWFVIVGISVLTTWQHHFVDLPTGALLGVFCLWLVPDGRPHAFAHATLPSDGNRVKLAMIYGLGSLGLIGVAAQGGLFLLALWPAAALGLVALAYAALGADVFRKGADGRFSAAARWLLLPYLGVARLNARLWTRGDRRPVEVAGGVFIGPLPLSAREAALQPGRLLDLAAEIEPVVPPGGVTVLPMLDLLIPLEGALEHLADTIEHHRLRGRMVVACALGYGRSAAAVSAWLVRSGRAQDAGDAFAMIQAVRPRARPPAGAKLRTTRPR